VSFPPSFAGATGLLAGTGAELLNGTLFAATDTALETKLAKWVPSLVDDLATVAALQSPQYTTLLRKTVLVSFLQNSTAGPPSLTDDTDAANIDNQVNFPADSVEIIFINLLGLTVQVKGEVVSTEAGEKYNIANVGCVQLTGNLVIPYNLSTSADETQPATAFYGLYGDGYSSADGSSAPVLGVVHVPGGPRESPSGVGTPTHDMLLPFIVEYEHMYLFASHIRAYKDETDGISLLYALLGSLFGSSDFQHIFSVYRGPCALKQSAGKHNGRVQSFWPQ